MGRPPMTDRRGPAWSAGPATFPPPGRRSGPRHARPAALAAVAMTGVLLLGIVLCGVAFAARSVVTQATRSPTAVVDAYVLGLWRWVGDIDADRGLQRANHESCEGLAPGKPRAADRNRPGRA